MSAGRSELPLRRLCAALALGAAVLLAIAELLPVYEVTLGPLEVVRRSTTGGENHGYALALVALAAIAVALLTLRGDASGAPALVALGAAALVIALAFDLPDTRGSGRLPESVAYEDARARAGPGLWLEIAGGALLVGAGLTLLAAPAAAPRTGGRAPADAPDVE